MKRKSILLSITLASLLNADTIKSIEFINLTKMSTTLAKETISISANEDISTEKINKAIKDFYDYGYFEDITVTQENGVLKFLFKEKPSIANVEITGYKSREDDKEELKKEINIKKGMMYSTQKIKSAKEALLKKLEADGYINSVVEVEIEKLNEDALAITFNVNKGDEIIIKKANYFGAKNLEQSDFEEVTANKEEEFASWFITQNGGELNSEQLEYDGKRIQELYFEHGYLDAKVEDPFVQVDFASDQADLDFYIDEGIQYNLKSVTIYVDPELAKASELKEEMKLKEGRVFNIKRMRDDIDFIKTKIADQGYAFAQVTQDIKKDEKEGIVDLVLNVIPGQKVYIRDVKITGNSRTLDRVIRRNVYLAPGDLFSQTDFKESKNKLKRTGYFDDVTIEQKRVSEDKMDLVVKIKEAPTGNIILGGGYGSYDKVMINAAINERNLFGSGISTALSVDLSSKESEYTVSIVNPAIADSKYTGSFDLYNRDQEYSTKDYYDMDKTTKGFTIGVGREIIRNLYGGLKYKLDFIKEDYEYISTYTKKKAENQDYVQSSLIPYVNYDNTDDYLVPRSGMKVGTSVEYAGVGGDSKFVKTNAYFKYFYSLNTLYDLDWILRYRAQVNFLIDNGKINQGDSLYLGGTKSLRGFESYAFGPDDPAIDDPYKRMFANSLELSFPLVGSSMRWGVFYDYGMIGENSFSTIKRSSMGALFEWNSPFGPLQLFFAQPLDDEPGDETSSFEFALGSSF
ncbi:outer membrane protein assembly factor BamA [Halarcobacter ebronensis]|uniref:Outer membrane protein assembly factor BamA n=1 Tax=Halarcobacter ebronensis TaxID=1462615 RepID=A0A4Q1AJ88_9BACT|nr:outer membrane protein assembly factor BamA [Halarcobacter ebronensis]QKF82030.1 beta-barrel assembly machinery complex, BamA/YaeT protein [Halarcobacter ebronensis]RXK04136.1 outer membrane protein assembly factor BamA [Halarcobacter ebronensis]